MNLNDYKVLTFDCYGTLIDWESGLLAFLQPWLRARRIEIGDEQLLEIYGRYEHRQEEGNPAALYSDLLARVLADLARHFELQLADAERGALAASLEQWPPFPDAVAVLQTLSQSHHIVILSNVDRALFSHSQRLLEVEFDAVITAEDVGSYKPAHGHFLRCFDAMAERGVQPFEILHVAQSLYHDHVPAKALGLATCWVNRRAGRPGWGATPEPEREVEPDLTVTCLEELLAYRT